MGVEVRQFPGCSGVSWGRRGSSWGVAEGGRVGAAGHDTTKRRDVSRAPRYRPPPRDTVVVVVLVVFVFVFVFVFICRCLPCHPSWCSRVVVIVSITPWFRWFRRTTARNETKKSSNETKERRKYSWQRESNRWGSTRLTEDSNLFDLSWIYPDGPRGSHDGALRARVSVAKYPPRQGRAGTVRACVNTYLNHRRLTATSHPVWDPMTVHPGTTGDTCSL